MQQPWERQAAETARQFQCFCKFLDLGPDRSIRKAVESDRGGPATVTRWKRWSSCHSWIARAEAYDAYVDAGERRELERARRKLELHRLRYELSAQDRIERVVDELHSKLLEALELPLISFERKTRTADGKRIAEKFVGGSVPQICGLTRALLDAMSEAINGPGVRVVVREVTDSESAAGGVMMLVDDGDTKGLPVSSDPQKGMPQ